MHFLIGFVLVLTAMFLMLIVLLQRGRGGGLAGALGGMGGQSAFGTKAGDLFTKITMVTAAVWILLCIGSLKVLSGGSKFTGRDADSQSENGTESIPPSSGDSKSSSDDKSAGENKAGGESKAGEAKSGGSAPSGLSPKLSGDVESGGTANSSSGSKPAQSPPPSPPASGAGGK